jgi:hypothetical protein
MKRGLAPLLLGAVVVVTGCGSTGTDAVADDVGTPVAHTKHTRWPAYPVADYSYRLRISCFCADAGVPVIVTVRGGIAVDAVYAAKGRGHAAGDEAGDWMRVTINDVIDAANTEHAYRKRVRWPDGQDYPSSVWVDPDANAADEEIGYSIRHVQPA